MQTSFRRFLNLLYVILFLFLIPSSIVSSVKPATNKTTPPVAPNIPCVQRSHCNSIGLSREDRSGDPLPFYARNCFCDDVCLMYRDCCSDYSGLYDGLGLDVDLQNNRNLDLSQPNRQSSDPQSGQESDSSRSPVPGPGHGHGHGPGRRIESNLQKERKKAQQSSVINHMTCQRVEVIDTSYEIYIVASCPSKFTKDEFVKSRCEEEHLSLDDPFLRLPVSDRDTGVLYRNIYCAICTNKRDEMNVIYWQPVYTCDSSSASLFFSEASVRLTLSELRGVMGKCRVEIQPPLGVNSPRKCKSHIDYCPRKSKGDSKCRNGPTAYVYYRLQVFKNRFCAQCHRLEMTDVQCEDGRTPWIEFDPGYLNPALSKSDVPQYSNNRDQPEMAVFSVDVARKSGNLTYSSGKSRNISIGDSCSGKGIVLDPFKSECRLMGCEDGWNFINGECVVDPNYTPPTTASTTTPTTKTITTTTASTTVPLTTTTTISTTATKTTLTRTSVRSVPKAKPKSTTRTPKPKKTTNRSMAIPTTLPTIENTVPVLDTSFEIDKLLNFKLNSEQGFDHDVELYEPEINFNETIDNYLHTSTARGQLDYPDFHSNPFESIDLTTPVWIGKEFSAADRDSTDESRYRQITIRPRSTTVTALKDSTPVKITSKPSGEHDLLDNIYDEEGNNDYGSAEKSEIDEGRTDEIPKRENDAFDEFLPDMYDVDEARDIIDNKATSLNKKLHKISLAENRVKDDHQPNISNNSKSTEREFQYISDTNDKLKSESTSPNENKSMFNNGDNDIFKHMIIFQYRPVEGLIAFVAGASSICALIGALLALILLPTRYPDIDRKPVGALVISLLLSQVTHLLALVANSPQGSQNLTNSACFYISALLHYFFFVSFLCVNVLAVDLCRIAFNISRSSGDSGCTREARFSAYSSYAWITPLLVILTGVMLDISGLENIIRPHYGDSNICWITGSYNQLVLFALPLVLITLADSVLFVVTAHRLCTASTSHDDVMSHDDVTSHDVRRFRRWLLLCVGLCVCVCATWMCAFGAAFSLAGERVGHIAFVVLNAGQGLIASVMTLSLCSVRRLRELARSRNDEVWKVDNISPKKKLKSDKVKDCRYVTLNNKKTEILSQETSI